MSQLAYIVVYLAMAGAMASWVAGAVFYIRTLSAIGSDGESARLKWLAVFAWPFAAGQLKGVAAEHAAKVNKSIVAFLVCLLIAVMATAAATNLHRLGK